MRMRVGGGGTYAVRVSATGVGGLGGVLVWVGGGSPAAEGGSSWMGR